MGQQTTPYLSPCAKQGALVRPSDVIPVRNTPTLDLVYACTGFPAFACACACAVQHFELRKSCKTIKHTAIDAMNLPHLSQMAGIRQVITKAKKHLVHHTRTTATEYCYRPQMESSLSLSLFCDAHEAVKQPAWQLLLLQSTLIAL